MAKKHTSLVKKVEQDNLKQKSPFNKDGVNSFLKDITTSQGSEFNESVSNEFHEAYGYDYDKMVDDIGRANDVPEANIETFRNDIYNQYGFSKPTETDKAEMSFVKTPVSADPKGGFEKYKALEDELSVTNAFIQNIQAGQPMPEEEPKLSEKDKLLESQLVSEQADVTKTVTPPESLRPADPRLDALHQKSAAIKQAIQEQQNYINVQEPKIDTEAEDSYLKDIGQSLYKGSAAISQAIVRLPSTIYRVAALPQNLLSNIPGLEGLEVSKGKNNAVLNFLDENQITEYYDNAVEEQRAKVSEYERSVTEQWKSGDVSGVFKTIGVQAAESIPLTLALMASGGFGVATEASIGIGAYATAQKLHTLDKRNPDMNESAKIVNSVFTGAAEAASESMSMGSIGIGKKLLQKEGAEGLRKLAERSFINTFNPVVKSIYNVSSPMIGEGLTEAASQYAENYVDYISGVKTDRNLMEGVMDSFVVGVAAGGTMSGPVSTYNEVITNPVARYRIKENFTKAEASLNDLTNGNYAKAVENIAVNHQNIEDTKEAFREVDRLFKDDISLDESITGSNYISSSINYQNTSKARRKAIEEKMAQSVGQDGNVTMTQYNGQSYTVNNPQDLGQDGKVVFIKDLEGNVKPVISSKITDWDSKTQEDVINNTIETEDQQDIAIQQEQQAQQETLNDATEKGLIEGKTVITPQGKQTLVSVNPDGSSTVTNNKGEQSTVNTDEIEAYKTQEQKEAEKAEEQAAQEIVSDELLDDTAPEGEQVRIIDYANGTSTIITPEGEQTFETTEDRDAAIEALVSAELEATEATEGTIDDLPPEQAFAQMLETDPDIANEVLTEDIAGIRNKAEELRAQSKEVQSRQERVNLLKQAKELETEAVRLEEILADPTLLVEKIAPDIVEEPVMEEEVIDEVTPTPEEPGTPFRAAPTEAVLLTDMAKEDLTAKTRVEPTLNELQAKFGIPIQVIHSSEMPEHVQRAAKGKQITASGFYDPATGTAYMVSDNIKRIADLKKTFMHEAVLHKGLDVLFNAGPVTVIGKTFNAKNELLDEVYNRLDEETIADRMQYYAKGVSLDQLSEGQKRELAEEAMATLNETESPRLQVLMDKLYNYIKKLFGFTTKQFSKAEFRQLLRAHRDLIIKQKQDAETIRSDEGQVQEPGDVREAITEEGREDIQQPEEARAEAGDAERVTLRTEEGQTETPEFKNWFGNSQIVDENGNPIVMYHATGEDFDAFITQTEEQVFGKGIIFASPDPKWAQEGFMPIDKEKGTSGSVMPLYVKSENPFDYRNEEHLNKLFEKVELRDKAKDRVREGSPWGLEKPKVVEAIKELGYDGVYVTEEGLTNIGVFEPNQVKSATGNIGAFDPDVADVRFKVEEYQGMHSAPMFRVADSQQELDDFVEDSKVKETVYHGSPVKGITDIKSGWFTNVKEHAEQYATDNGETYSARININNPVPKEVLDSNITPEDIRKEYDGIIIPPKSKELGSIYIPFSPDQILIEPKEDVKFKVEEERDKIETDPSEAQIDAGNYQKGHVQFDGFDISIENPKGSIRKGTNEEGESWSSIMPGDYGYFKGTIGKDKDHIDTYLGDNLESDKVYVVDQVNPETGSFDEHKVMVGYNSLSEAKTAYMEAYEEGWQGLGAITRTTKDGLKEWFKGDTKKPFAPESDVRFQVTSKDPKIQAMLDRLAKVQEMSKTAARVKGLEQEQLQAIGPQRKFIQDKIELYKEAVAEGKAEATELIKEVQGAITDYAKKTLPLTEAGAREIGPVLTLIKNTQTPEDAEAAFNRIDELAGVTTEKQERRKHVAKVNRLLKWMTGLKKSGTKRVGKFNYEDTKAFQELKDINKIITGLTKIKNSTKATEEQKAEVESKLDQEWNNLNEKENRNTLDDAILKLIELRRLGSKASPALAKAVSEELEAIYSDAKDAKSEADIEKSISRKADKEFVKEFVRDDSLEDKPLAKRAMTSLNNFTANTMGNWETLMTMLGGNKARDKFSLILNQVEEEMGIQSSFNKVLDKAQEDYNLKSRDKVLKHIQELKKEDYELRKPNRAGKAGEGKPIKLSKMNLIDIHNALKNEDIANSYYLSYGDISLAEDGSQDREAQIASGKNTINSLLDNLTNADKAFADSMMEVVQTYKESTNNIFIKMFNRDMDFVENYWPSTAEFESDVDVMDKYYTDGKMPTATQQRSQGRTPRPVDAFDKFNKHVKESEWYKNMALPLDRINKIFKDQNVIDLISEAKGDKFLKTIQTHFKNLGLGSSTRDLTDVERVGGNILGNWVSAKIGLTPSVPFKQLTSMINYAENMPVGRWGTGFIKGLATPKATFDFMWENVPYLQDRFKGGYSEALQYAMNATSGMPKATNTQQAIKNIATIGTRGGDIAAIVFGGKPYIDYLMKKKGMSKDEAVKKFMLDTLRSQQSPFSSTLSTYQNSKNPFAKALFTFANTPSQYMRKMFEANQAYKHGDITKTQLGKIYAIYGVANQFLYVGAGALISAMMKGSDPGDELWENTLVQSLTSLVAGIPMVRDLVNTTLKRTTGLHVYDDALPVIGELDQISELVIKSLQGKDAEKNMEKAALLLLEMGGIPAGNAKKLWDATVNREEVVAKTAKYEVRDKLNELVKSDNNFEARKAKELKSAYSKAKSKATRLKKEGKVLQAGMIESLIEESRMNLKENNYDKLGSELRMFEARLKAID